MSADPPVRAVQQLTTRQAQLLQPALPSLFELLAKQQIQSKLTWLSRVCAKGTGPLCVRALLFVTAAGGFVFRGFSEFPTAFLPENRRH